MIDLDIVSEGLDVEAFIRNTVGVKCYNVTEKDMLIECPNPLHRDKHPSCHLSREMLVWHCFGCESRGSIIDLVTSFMGLSYERAEDLIVEHAGLTTESVTDTFKKRFVEIFLPVFEFSKPYRTDWVNANGEILDFIKNRKFNLFMFDDYKIGFNNELNSITIPVVHGGDIVNIAERYIKPKGGGSKIKYRSGAPLGRHIWGIVNGYNRSNPYFTEGVFDALRLIEAGYNAFAILTNQMTDSKFRMIKECFDGVITIVPDNDNGGKVMVNNWRPYVHESVVDVVKVPNPYKDIDEVPLCEIDEVVSNRFNMVDLMNYELMLRIRGA